MRRGRDWLTQSYVGRLIGYVSTSCYEEPETKHPECNTEEPVDNSKLRETKLENLLQRVQDTKVRISKLADISEPPPAKRVKIEVRRLEEPKESRYFGPKITIHKPFLLEKRRDFPRANTEDRGRRVIRNFELKPMQHINKANTELIRDDLDKPVFATSTSTPEVRPPLTSNSCPLTPQNLRGKGKNIWYFHGSSSRQGTKCLFKALLGAQVKLSLYLRLTCLNCSLQTSYAY
jgi:hypothetical protein